MTALESRLPMNSRRLDAHKFANHAAIRAPQSPRLSRCIRRRLNAQVIPIRPLVLTMWFFSNGHAMDKYRHGDRPFALVTGSSLGIGRELALELAALKYNVVIHARTEEELVPVRDEIKKRHPGTTVICLAQDAGVKVNWPQLMNQIADLNITVLINNVGTSPPIPFNALDAATDEQIETVMRINTIFPTQLTRNMLPMLVKHSPSLILNMCSASTYAPMGFITVYCGTKASNLVWSQALYNELGLLRRDVECKAVMTGSVVTHGNSQPGGTFVPIAEVYAKSMLARAGSSGPVYNGYWRHTIQFGMIHLIAFLSPSILDSISAGVAKDLLVWRASIRDETALKVTDLPK